MKKILLITILFFAFLSSHAQKAAVVPFDNFNGQKPAALAATETRYYCCPKCDFTADKEQPCPLHQFPLVKVGNYYCLGCGKYSSKEPGNCPENHGPKVRMNMKYVLLKAKEEDKSGVK